MNGTNEDALIEEAISYAAYRLLRHRFRFSPGGQELLNAFDQKMSDLGFDIANTSMAYQNGSAAALGNFIAKSNEVPLADVAYSLNVTREDFKHRTFLLANSSSDASENLLSSKAINSKSAVLKVEPNETGFLFPGQGAQFSGMGLDLYENSPLAQELFEKANDILGFSITDIMFEGSAEDLKETKVTQPAIFLHSVILAKTLGDNFQADMVAGHSLGEFSALVAAGALTFEDGLRLVSQRAQAMQKACELQPSTMAAVLGLDDAIV